jgi:hypothetical protein
MGLTCMISETVDRITDSTQYSEYEREIERSDFESFHEAIEQRAYFAAERDGFKENPQIYWNAAKASVVLELVGDFDGMLKPRFNPSREIQPLDQEDAEIIYSALRFQGIQTNYNKWVNGKVKDYIKNKWSSWLSEKKEI